MTPEPAGRLVLFEPWSLGDVVIAASVLRELRMPATLACHPDWHAILRGAFTGTRDLDLLSIALPYTTRKRTHAFDSAGEALDAPRVAGAVVLSIRGDARDYAAARKLFPGASIRMTGWVRFFARKSALVNAPYAAGLCRVRNRYRSWARLTGTPFSQVEQTYRRLQANAPVTGKIAIHFGAQWRSKQFPHVAALRDRLKTRAWEVVLLGGPGDPLPAGIAEKDVTRVADLALLAQLRSAEHVITNDSAPMHLAAFLGCRTTAVVRTSPVEEWAPPATGIIASAKTPRGYRPHPRYMSDDTLSDWPEIENIIEGMEMDLSRSRRDVRVPR